MNLTASLSLAKKGEVEVLSRSCNCNVRQRSILLLLVSKPQTLGYIFTKLQIVEHEEIMGIINKLASEGFVVISGGSLPSVAASALTANNQLLDGIIISEAKFLLVDFCVDSFGTKSQQFVDELGNCKDENHLRTCLKSIYEAITKHCPQHMSKLKKIIAEINETA